MKILVIGDEPAPALWDFYDRSLTRDVDLILSCGDLPPEYLEFLVTVVNRPLYYVRGNHDGIYDERPPQGCESAESRILSFHGLRILGLGGSLRYRPGKDMYTEEEMKSRIRKLRFGLKASGGFDLLLTHAPARGQGDLEDPAHRGFECFNDLLMKYHPCCMVYGHIHPSYGQRAPRERKHPSGTRLFCGSGYGFLSIGGEEYPSEERNLRQGHFPRLFGR